MSEDITPKQKQELDGFDLDDDVDRSDDDQAVVSMLRGPRVSYTNENKWVTQDGELPPSIKLLADHIDEANVLWGKEQGPPIKVIPRGFGPKLENVKELNDQIDESQWREWRGQLRGLWDHQYYVYLRDPQTLQEFTYVTSTIGGGIAVRELKDKVKWMRKMRGLRVHAIVIPSNTFMSTRHGGRQRPHFVIDGWVRFGGGDVGELTALPAPAQQALDRFATGAQKVEEPSLKEEMKDEIPW